MSVTLTIDGSPKLFASLHEAMREVHVRFVTVVQARRALLDAEIELGKWLEAVRAHVPHGEWERSLSQYGINRKRAARATRLSQWDAKGRPNLPPLTDTQNLVRHGGHLGIRQAEIAAGIRRPAAPAPTFEDDDSPAADERGATPQDADHDADPPAGPGEEDAAMTTNGEAHKGAQGEQLTFGVFFAAMEATKRATDLARHGDRALHEELEAECRRHTLAVERIEARLRGGAA